MKAKKRTFRTETKNGKTQWRQNCGWVGRGRGGYCGCVKAAPLHPLQSLFLHFKTRRLLHVTAGLTIKKSRFDPHSVFKCFVSISEQNEFTSPHMEWDRNLAQTGPNPRCTLTSLTATRNVTFLFCTSFLDVSIQRDTWTYTPLCI
jgi:hypothetical protein